MYCLQETEFYHFWCKVSMLKFLVLYAGNSTSIHEELAKKRAASWGRITVINQGAVSPHVWCVEDSWQRSKGGVNGEDCQWILDTHPQHTHQKHYSTILHSIGFYFPNFGSLTPESLCRPRLLFETMLLILLWLQCFQTNWRAKQVFTGYLSEISSGLKYGCATDGRKFFLNLCAEAWR